ncbi:DUF2085 domain-containing protein [Clostridium sp. C8-1-8]|uniref:DUF2085 domain-containing protein n=1 Tax=Clostridium sp. C8-1-8 TaxID=2698831 RepID=UPI00136B5CE2|nr:DUF2085 domain-containing protein [Clostridium sp. C8-1-8]
MFLCHKKPERSFFYKGKDFPICARCTGILAGYFLGFLYLILIPHRNYFLEILFMLPIAIDGTGQYLQKCESTNIRRLATGILAGMSTICILSLAILLGWKHGLYLNHLLVNSLRHK